MSDIQFKNQFLAELASNLTTVATTLTLKSGQGANFPVVATGEEKHFFVTVVNNAGSREIIKIIKRASGSDVLTVGSSVSDQSAGNVSGRAQEGTSALAITYTDDHLVELRLTAGIMQDIADRIATLEEYDLNGVELILDADGDTSVTADTDDRIDFKVSGTDQLYIGNAQIVPFTDNVIALGLDNYRFAYMVSRIMKSTECYTETFYAYVGSSYIAQGKDITEPIHRAKVDIGDWNMDATADVTIAHGLTTSKIINISGMIRNDAGDALYPINTGTAGGYLQINAYVTGSNIFIQRLGSGSFDNANFNSTGFNRGWIIIEYVD